MDKIEKFTLISKDRSRIKVFEPFEEISKTSLSIDAMMISYGCLYTVSYTHLTLPTTGSV